VTLTERIDWAKRILATDGVASYFHAVGKTQAEIEAERMLSELVDAIRQHTAGIGADGQTLSLLIEAANVDASSESELQRALLRLLSHVDSIDRLCTDALMRARENSERTHVAEERTLHP
jgi:hypothetical protein